MTQETAKRLINRNSWIWQRANIIGPFFPAKRLHKFVMDVLKNYIEKGKK